MSYGLNQNSAPNLNLVKTALDKLLDQAQQENTTVGKAEATDPVVFTQDGQSGKGRAAVVSAVLGGGGYFETTTDDLQPNKNATISASSAITTLIVQFKKDLPISRTFFADQQQMAVSRTVAQQAKTWAASRDRNAFSVYANGFTTQLAGADGVALFSNSHTNQNGDTIDNLETGALNDGNLNIVVNSLRTQLSQTGVVLGYEPKYLLTSSLGHHDGMATAKSVLRAGTGNNDLNYWSEMYPGMKVVFSPFLDTTSTSAYFVGGSSHGVVRFENEAFFTELTPWQYSPNDAYTYKMRAREAVDSLEYSGVVASTGTTA